MSAEVPDHPVQLAGGGCDDESGGEDEDEEAASNRASEVAPRAAPALALNPDSSTFNGEIRVSDSVGTHIGDKHIYTCNGPTIVNLYKNSGLNQLPVDTRHPNGHRLEFDVSTGKPTTSVPSSPKEKWYGSSRRLASGFLTAALLITAASMAGWLLLRGSPSTAAPDDRDNPAVPALLPNDSSINNDPTIPGLLIIRRVQWGAQPPNEPPTRLAVLPPVYVIISHTATVHCFTQAQCVLNVRVAQTFHIESQGWNDIAYNFLVGGDGLVYEGRGWGIEGAHTFNYNNRSIGLSFIGTFNHDLPTKAQLHAARKLVAWGVEHGRIDPGYKLLGHRQCIKTESPGQELYDIIRTWEHWSPTP